MEGIYYDTYPATYDAPLQISTASEMPQRTNLGACTAQGASAMTLAPWPLGFPSLSSQGVKLCARTCAVEPTLIAHQLPRSSELDRQSR